MTDPALIAAHGKLVALLASVLQGAGVTTTTEFSELLSLYAGVVGETEPIEGEILELWAETVARMLPPTQRH